MKWQGRRKSSNIEDRRGRSGSFGGGGGFSPLAIGMLMRVLFSKTGLVVAGIFILIMWVTGTNPLALLQQFTGGSVGDAAVSQYEGSTEEEALADFSAVVLAETEAVWNQLLENYREPTLVFFTGSVQSACGTATSASGPFYCPGDERLYIDLSFYQELKERFNAPGDFAQAYVIAHEVGHHVQNLMGLTDKVQAMRARLSDEEYNKMSVRLELQADYLSGVWAHHAQNTQRILEEGDIEEALMAASAIGDDRIQKQTQGRVVPDSFTHGTSEQRMRWFKKGFETGGLSQWDTFSAEEL
ncbi:MAG: neutral zinc metallopeptidase [Anditalea sp.]